MKRIVQITVGREHVRSLFLAKSGQVEVHTILISTVLFLGERNICFEHVKQTTDTHMVHTIDDSHDNIDTWI
jgi:hypothetical protein